MNQHLGDTRYVVGGGVTYCTVPQELPPEGMLLNLFVFVCVCCFVYVCCL